MTNYNFKKVAADTFNDVCVSGLVCDITFPFSVLRVWSHSKTVLRERKESETSNQAGRGCKLNGWRLLLILASDCFERNRMNLKNGGTPNSQQQQPMNEWWASFSSLIVQE